MGITRRQLLAATPLALAAGGRLWGAELLGGATFPEQTPQSEAAINRGTQWLLKTQRGDGGCGPDLNQPSDIGCSAMVGLALLAQGITEVEGPRRADVRKIVRYLLNCVDRMPNDDITSETQTQLQVKIGRHAHTFFATLFLSQSMGEEFDVGTTQPKLRKLVDTVCKTQNKDGHWGAEAWAPTLGTVMGWCCLRGAHMAGFSVAADAKRAADYLIRSMKHNLTQGGQSWMHTLYKNATGVRVLYSVARDNEEIARKCFADALKLISQDSTPFTQAGGEEYLAFHLITETMLQKGGTDWRKWYPTCRDKIISVQNEDGSWTGHHCITSRTFCTAAAVLVLSAPNRYLPISQE